MSKSFFAGAHRWTIFFAWLVLCCLFFYRPLWELFQLASTDDTASHILLTPFISGWLIFVDRQRIQTSASPGRIVALGLLVSAGVVTFLSYFSNGWTAREQISGYILGLVLFVSAGFVAILGVNVAKASWFGLALLLFAVPIPDAILDRIIFALQAGSAAIAEFFFDLSGTPVLREGFIFRLPNMSIEVAKECSGIRSSIALLILALLVAHFSFRPLWKKILFVASGLGMMLVKNGIRIATLTLLANYVDPAFLYGKLHHQGGIVFFLIGLCLLAPVYWILRRGESQLGDPGQAETAGYTPQNAK